MSVIEPREQEFGGFVTYDNLEDLKAVPSEDGFCSYGKSGKEAREMKKEVYYMKSGSEGGFKMWQMDEEQVFAVGDVLVIESVTQCADGTYIYKGKTIKGVCNPESADRPMDLQKMKNEPYGYILTDIKENV